MSEKKTAWVIGATGFWGRNVVLSLLRSNWRVTAFSRSKPEDLLAWAEASNQELDWVPLDLDNLDLEQLPPPPEALFNCASVFDEDLERMLCVNTLAPIALIEHVLPKMVSAAYGRLAVFVGQNARIGLPGLGGFSATQAGLWTWAEAQARALNGSGVTLTLVFPPRAPSKLQRNLAEQLGTAPKLSKRANADPLVASVLHGCKRAGRRPWLAAVNGLCWIA